MKNTNRLPDNNPATKYGFEILFKADGKYYFQFNDAEGKPLLFSKGYTSEKSCANGVKTAIRLTHVKERYHLKKAKKGTHFFTLKSSNHKEIARSRLFDTLDALKQQLPLLQNTEHNPPPYSIQDQVTKPKKELPVEKKQKTPTSAKKEAPAEARKISLMEDTEEMPRYKYSVIYYPDSSIWKLRSDFSEASTKLKSLDGMKMAIFLKDQLPSKIQKTIQLETSAEAVAPPAPAAAEAITKAKPKVTARQQVLPEHIDLLIKTREGKLISRFMKPGSLAKVEVSPAPKKGLKLLIFEGTVTVESLSTRNKTIIGGVKNQCLVNGQLSIPISNGNNLNKGWYRFLVDISGVEKGGKTCYYHNSELVKLI